ncbi:MAG: hypothetical protein AB1714_22405 [Acidobacteriota bacterium]
MYGRRGLILGWLILAFVPWAGAYEDSRISQAAADKMERVLNDVLKRRQQGKELPKTVVFTERELNSYLYYKAGSQLPPNLKNIDIGLQENSVVAQADVDLSDVKSQNSEIPDFLKRPIPIYLTGRLTTQKGWGYFQPESIRVGFLPIPVSALDAIVQYLTERQSGKAHSLKDWFALPYGIKEVRINKERLILVP